MKQEIFVPGRVCIVGEHSDWAAGYRRMNSDIAKGLAIVVPTSQGISAYFEPQKHSLMAVSSGFKLPFGCPMEDYKLLEYARRGGFWSYIAGTAYQINRRFKVDGLCLNIDSNLPCKRGLSSSAAVCVLTVRAFNMAYFLGLSVDEEMELAYLGETTTPSRCGRMDQACAYGKPVLMEFDGDDIDIMPIDVEHDVHLVIVDLGARKDTIRILACLNRAYPFPQGSADERLHDFLGRDNRMRVDQAVGFLHSGDAAKLGLVMNSAQDDFDRIVSPFCPDELVAPVLHKVLNHPLLKPHILGGKGIGSGGDGCCQFVVESEEKQKEVIGIVERELKMKCFPLTVCREKIDAMEVCSAS